MPYVNDPGDWSQVAEELAIEQAEAKFEQYKCCCPRCDRFGIVSGSDDYYGTVYECSCLPVDWVIDPETGEKVERG
jgi:hypothetical protein